MTGTSELQITRYYSDHSAPAEGDGTRYECSDLSVWRAAGPWERSHGYRSGGVIVPDKLNNQDR